MALGGTPTATPHATGNVDRPTVAFVTAPDLIGVDHWRVFGAARLMGDRARVVRLGEEVPLIEGRPPDVLVCSQRGSSRAGGYAHLRDRLCRPHGILLVVDCCDDPLSPDGWVAEQRARIADQRGWTAAEAARDALAAADLVTVNTPQMAAVVRRLNPQVAVVPDLIDGERWTSPAYRRIEGLKEHTYVGVAGGLGHDEDWRVLGEAWPVIGDRYPGVAFVVLGALPDHLDRRMRRFGERFRHVPWLSIDRYQHGYAILDIGCAPLADTRWNASKSPNRFYEYSLAGAATVASPLVYGTVIRDGVSGLLATTVEQWVAALEAALDPTTRARLVEVARRDVIDRYSLTRERVADQLAIYQRHHRRVYGDRTVERVLPA